MIRIYFVFEDPLDDSGVNLSFVDVPTRDPGKAIERVREAAGSGELWKAMYPDDREHPYKLIKSKMSYLDISALPRELTQFWRSELCRWRPSVRNQSRSGGRRTCADAI